MILFSFSLSLIIIFVILVVLCVKGLILQSELGGDETIDAADKICKSLFERKKTLYQRKIDLENEALEIFTLYEITKDITKSLNEEDAFNIFRTKLEQHVSFKECIFLDAGKENVKEKKQDQGFFVFTIQGKKRKIGYLIIEGLVEEDKEKVSILGHQFALALRRVKLYEEIERIAITDSLTEVHTRRYSLDRFQEEIQRSGMRKIHMSFLMIDVDFFKKINDQFGHLAGDQVLREVGSIIKGSIREIDIAGRYGGEEFCVVLPDTDTEGARFVAERIRTATEETTIKAYDATVQTTLSIGIATFPIDAKNMGDMIDRADWALYQAKDLGRNRICLYGEHKGKK